MNKKLIRGILKIPASFIVIPGLLVTIAVGYGMIFMIYLHDKNTTEYQEGQEDFISMLKVWCTTI